MVRTHARRPRGGQIAKKRTSCHDEGHDEGHADVESILRSVGLQSFRAVDLSSSDDSGEVMTGFWKEGTPYLIRKQSDLDHPVRRDAERHRHQPMLLAQAAHDQRDATQEVHQSHLDKSLNASAQVVVNARPVSESTMPPKLYGTGLPIVMRGRCSTSREGPFVNTMPARDDDDTKAYAFLDEPPLQPTVCMDSFRIDEEDKVTSFLTDRLRKFQQLAGKRVAKSWIKGICAKKQAMFPYRNKHRGAEHGLEPEVPGWWPDVSVCPYIEPDHVRRGYRTHLILHLLRLRPEPSLLKAWNKGKVEPSHIVGEWTKFLKSLTPRSVVDNMRPEPREKVHRRWDYLMEIYEVADMEEQYRSFGMGGDRLYQWHDEKPVSGKRRRCGRSVGSGMAHDDDAESRSSSVDRSSVNAKRQRQQSRDGASSPGAKPANLDNADVPAPEMIDLDGPRRATLSGTEKASVGQAALQHGSGAYEIRDAQNSTFDDNATIAWSAECGIGSPMKRTWNSAHEYGVAAVRTNVMDQQLHPPEWQTPGISPSTSFEGSTFDQAPAFAANHVPAGFSLYPGQHDYAFPLHYYPNQQVSQTYHGAQMQALYNDIVPNTPVFSPMSLESTNSFESIGGMPPITRSIPAQAYPFLGSFEDQQILQPSQQVNHGLGPLPMVYPDQMAPVPHQAISFGYQDRQFEHLLEQAPSGWPSFAAGTYGMASGQPT